MTSHTYIQAGHPATGAGELALLARHSDMRIRQRVAENCNTPLNVLLMLAVDCEPEVRLALALHPFAPACLLRHLAQDHSVDVRYELAEMPHLPLDVLKILTKDDNPYVADRARRSLSARKKYFRNLWEGSDMVRHTVKVFTGGTLLGYETLNILASTVLDPTDCEIVECDIRYTENLVLAEQLGVRAIPTIVVDNKIAWIGRPTADDLIDLGIPTLLSA